MFLGSLASLEGIPFLPRIPLGCQTIAELHDRAGLLFQGDDRNSDPFFSPPRSPLSFN